MRVLAGALCVLALAAGESTAAGGLVFTRADGSQIGFPGAVRVLELGIEATLGSEFCDGTPVKVAGTFPGRVSSPPPGR